MKFKIKPVNTKIASLNFDFGDLEIPESKLNFGQPEFRKNDVELSVYDKNIAHNKAKCAKLF